LALISWIFSCTSRNLAIEVDGGHHAQEDVKQYDETRTLYLNENGIHVLRFWNNEVLNNIDGVVEVKCNWLNDEAA